MKKYRLQPCFACYFGEDKEVTKCEKQKLSRKKKKKLKKAYRLWRELLPGNLEMWEGLSSCHQVNDYKYYFPLIKKIDYLQKYKKVFIELKKFSDDNCEELEFTRYKNDYVLAFPWEDYNGLYGEYGHMPMQFGKDPENGTWAYEESKHCCEHFGLDISEIKNENHFLKLAGKKLDVVNKEAIK